MWVGSRLWWRGDTTVHPECIIVRTRELRVLESGKLLYSVLLGSKRSVEYSTVTFVYLYLPYLCTRLLMNLMYVHLPSLRG